MLNIVNNLRDKMDYEDFLEHGGSDIGVEAYAKMLYEEDNRWPIAVYILMIKERTGSTKSKGLGDTVAKITHATGLAKLAELYTEITGRDCGCKSRQEALNKLFPYGVKENG